MSAVRLASRSHPRRRLALCAAPPLAPGLKNRLTALTLVFLLLARQSLQAAFALAAFVGPSSGYALLRMTEGLRLASVGSGRSLRPADARPHSGFYWGAEPYYGSLACGPQNLSAPPLAPGFKNRFFVVSLLRMTKWAACSHFSPFTSKAPLSPPPSAKQESQSPAGAGILWLG